MNALADLKQHLELLDDADDAQLERLIAVAESVLANDIGADAARPYAELPPALQQAVLFKAAHLFANREPVLVDHNMVKLAMGYDDLIATYIRQVC